MRKIVFFCLFVYAFLFIPSPAYGQQHTIVIYSETTIPNLISGPDYATAKLFVMSPDGVAFTVTGTWGIDFRTGTDFSAGEAKYFDTPSPSVFGTITVPANGDPVDVGAKLGETFQSLVVNNTGTCLTSADKAFARARYTPGDNLSLTITDPLATQITNIGAMIGVLKVLKSDGTPAVGASVTFNNWDSDPGTHPATTDSFGQVLGIHRLNCSNSHTITASLGGETRSIVLPAQTGSTPNTICNGNARDFTIQMAPAATPTSTPTPTITPFLTPPVPPPPGPPKLICYNNGGLKFDAEWYGNSNTTGCNIWIQAGNDANQISTACNGREIVSSLATSGQIVPGGSYKLFANDGPHTYESQLISCPVGGCSISGSPTCDGVNSKVDWTINPTSAYCQRLQFYKNNVFVSSHLCTSSLTTGSLDTDDQVELEAVDKSNAILCASNAVSVCAIITPTPSPTPTPTPFINQSPPPNPTKNF